MAKRKKAQPIYIKCNKCEQGDKPTVWANNGWRVGYTFVCWIWLGAGITEGNAFFISLGMFSLPLLVDYLSFKTSDTLRQKIKWMQIAFCTFFCLIGILGGFECLTIIKVGNILMVQSTNKHILLQNININLVLMYRFSAILIVSTVVDSIIRVREIECILENNIELSA